MRSLNQKLSHYCHLSSSLKSGLVFVGLEEARDLGKLDNCKEQYRLIWYNPILDFYSVLRFNIAPDIVEGKVFNSDSEFVEVCNNSLLCKQGYIDKPKDTSFMDPRLYMNFDKGREWTH